MATSYTTLVGAKTVDGSIKQWVNHNSIPSTSIVSQAQTWIYEKIRAREMIKSGSLAIANGAASAALPTGFLDPISLTLDGDGRPLRYVFEGSLRQLRDDDGALTQGRPTRWSIIDNAAVFDVETDEDLTGRLVYYATPAALSAENPQNFLTDRFETLLFRACMMRAAEFLKNEGDRQYWLGLAEQAIEEANVAADLARRGMFIEAEVP